LRGPLHSAHDATHFLNQARDDEAASRGITTVHEPTMTIDNHASQPFMPCRSAGPDASRSFR
jgi:hypothetical protein